MGGAGHQAYESREPPTASAISAGGALQINHIIAIALQIIRIRLQAILLLDERRSARPTESGRFQPQEANEGKQRQGFVRYSQA
jgi:hypothetical protein